MDGFEKNPVYLSLTETERKEFVDFVFETKSKFKDIEQVLSEDPVIAQMLSQMQSSKGFLFSFNLFTLFASLAVVLLLLLL